MATAYIGSRTDGGHEDMPMGGVMIVDISDPSEPSPHRRPAVRGPRRVLRELRVWRSQDVLIVLNTNCGVGDMLHHCTQPSISNIRFYDIRGANATNAAAAVQRCHTRVLPLGGPERPEPRTHLRRQRGSSCVPQGGATACPLSVWDISGIRSGATPATLYSGLHGYTRFPAFPAPLQIPTGGLHSLSVSNDGQRAFFALLTGFAVADVSDFANGVPNPQPRRITINENRPHWDGPGASAVKFWGRDWAYVSDEVYGTATGADHGCPWGWARMVDISGSNDADRRGRVQVAGERSGRLGDMR